MKLAQMAKHRDFLETGTTSRRAVPGLEVSCHPVLLLNMESSKALSLHLLSSSNHWPLTGHNNLGPSIFGTCVVAFAHTDGTHTVTRSLLSLQNQFHVVEEFAKYKALSLNPNKYEVVIISPSKVTDSSPVCITNDPHLPNKNAPALSAKQQHLFGTHIKNGFSHMRVWLSLKSSKCGTCK